MKESDILREQYEDSLFSLLMKRHAEIEGEALLRQNRELNADESAAVPEAIAESGRRVIRKTLAEKNRKSTTRHIGKVFLRIAIAALITVSLLGAALGASASLRRSAMNLLMKMDPQMASWLVDREENDGKIHITATWIPNTFYRVDNQSDEFWAELIYENGTGGSIHVFAGSFESTIYETNTASALKTETLMLQGSEAILTKNENVIKISWFDATNCLSIDCESNILSKEDLILFASSLIFS